eukprot:GHVR01139881.1.p1 GENE.GHVR01139881.1~~GHVR01139881.1.p1  ORF type:complete len:125 (+),score=15.98 GHVR01139881.1:127-501(+)
MHTHSHTQISTHTHSGIPSYPQPHMHRLTQTHFKIYKIYNYKIYNYKIYDHKIYNYKIYNYKIYNYKIYNYKTYNYIIYIYIHNTLSYSIFQALYSVEHSQTDTRNSRNMLYAVNIIQNYTLFY